MFCSFRLRKDFKSLLEETGYVTPGKKLDEVGYLTTVCPRSSATFYIVTYYIKWVTTSWTYSTYI